MRSSPTLPPPKIWNVHLDKSLHTWHDPIQANVLPESLLQKGAFVEFSEESQKTFPVSVLFSEAILTPSVSWGLSHLAL